MVVSQLELNAIAAEADCVARGNEVSQRDISYCLNEFRTPGHRRSDSAELPVASPRFASDYMGCWWLQCWCVLQWEASSASGDGHLCELEARWVVQHFCINRCVLNGAYRSSS